MSHAANIYVKKLKAAPNGSPILASERALLWYLADCHSEEMGGICWPSINTLADHANLSVRHSRRLLEQLETKGIIGIVAQLRENGSRQSNNYYFVELQALPLAPAPRFEACGKAAENGGKRTKNGAKASAKPADKSRDTTPSPLTPTSGGDDASDRGTLTPVSPLEAPIEAFREAPAEQATATTGDETYSQEQTTSKTKTARAHESPVPQPAAPQPKPALVPQPPPLATLKAQVFPHAQKWEEFKAELLRQLEKLPEKLRDGAVEVFNETIRDTYLVDEACDGDSLVPVWTVSATDPETTKRGLGMLKANVKAALWKTAKGEVQVQVYGGEQ